MIVMWDKSPPTDRINFPIYQKMNVSYDRYVGH
jgi:hypothetical protein